MGLRWLSLVFYPERFGHDLAGETRRFYKLFYHVDLNDEQVGRLLEWAKGRAPGMRKPSATR
jgi:iron complex transport system substrate-binding protein